MAGNFIRVTDAGRAALVAQGNTGTNEHRVTEVGLCTAAFVFDPAMTVMPNERKRVNTFGGKNVAKDTIHVTIQDTTNDQYSLYGYGLYLENGVLAAVYVQSTPIMEKSPAAYLMLASDMQFVSIDVTKLVFGDASFLNPPASETVQGVIELATQEEVNDGKDALRAVTPKTAAAWYAPLIRPKLTGPASITSAPTDQDAQLSVAAASGALNRDAKIRFHGTFAAGTVDTNARFVASIRSGYDAGTWGREYLDFWINRTPNDANSDANQIRAMRITYGGRVVVGNRDDDGKTAFQVGGDGAFTGGISSSGLDAGGANIRLRNGRDVLLRNDGANFYLLLSNNSDAGASWNSFRPLTVNVVTGAVMLDDTGAGTYVGGQLAVKGMLNVSNGPNEARMQLGPSGGYFFGTSNAAGFYLPSTGAMFAFDFAKKNLTVVGNEVWNTGNLPNPAQTTGITMSGQILAAEGTVTRPGYSFVNDGAPDTGLYHIADGAFAVANNGRETMRFVAGEKNRVLIGGATDDLNSALQVGGAASFTGAAPGNGLAVPAMGSGVMLGNNGGGTIIFKSATSATDMKVWDFKAGDGIFQGRAITDGWTSGVPWITVARQSGGNSIQTVALVPNGGRVLVGGAVDDGSILNAEGLVRGRAYAVDGGASWATMYFKNGNATRFTIGKSDTDDFAISSFENDGTTQRRVLDIQRLTQQVNFVKRPAWAGATPWDSMNVTPLDKNAGGQVNANVTLYGAGDYGSQLVFNSNGYTPRVQVQASAGKWMVTNGANTAANLSVTDGGTVTARGELQAADGAVRVATDGNLYGGLWGGWLSNHLPSNYVNRAGGTMWGRLTLMKDGWDADLGLRAADGASTYLRARRGGGIELINNTYNAVTWSIDDWGTMYMRGQQILTTDGNLNLTWRGRYLSAEIDDIWGNINARASAGARVQWDSGVNNFGTVDRLNGALPAPWVVCGLSGPGNGTANAITVYGVVLRNQ